MGKEGADHVDFIVAVIKATLALLLLTMTADISYMLISLDPHKNLHPSERQHRTVLKSIRRQDSNPSSDP